MSLNNRADLLVKRLKNWTRNNDQVNQSGDRQAGINEALLLFYLNEGKDHIQTAVANARSNAFLSPVVKAITSELTEFPIPEEAIMGNRVARLDYGLSNANSAFYKLDVLNTAQWSYAQGSPLSYHIEGFNVVPFPTPASGFYKFKIQKRDVKLDIRRGKIAASGGINTSGGNLISVVLENTVDAPNTTALEDAEYVCFCDRDGTVVLSNVPIASYASASFTLAVDGTFPYTTGLSVGNYVTIGKNSSTHSTLPPEFENYITEWTKYSILLWDTAEEIAVSEIPKMQSMRQELIENMADIADMEEIPEYGSLTGDW